MKLTNLLFSLLLLSFVACTKDDVNNTSSNNIEGTWKLTSMTCNDGVTSTITQGVAFNTTYVASGKNFDVNITFTSNPNVFLSKGMYTQVVVSKLDGNTYTNETSSTFFENSGSWLKDGNSMTFSSPGQPNQTLEILKLDAKNFECKQVLVQTIDQGDGIISIIKGTYFFKMSR